MRSEFSARSVVSYCKMLQLINLSQIVGVLSPSNEALPLAEQTISIGPISGAQIYSEPNKTPHEAAVGFGCKLVWASWKKLAMRFGICSLETELQSSRTWRFD